MHLCGLLKTGFYNVASEEMISTLRPSKNTLVDEHGMQAANNVKEKEITNEKKPKTVESDEEISSVSFLSLFRYSSYIDKFLIGIGIALAVLSAACVPLLVANISFTMEELVAFDISLKNETSGNYTSKIARSITMEEFLKDIASLCTWSVILSLFNVVGNYVSVAFFSLAAANQVFRIRCRFMQAVVRQDIAWFDTNKTGDFVAKFTRELNLIQEGIGEKVVILLDHCARTAVCFGLSLYYGWKLTLVILCVIPVLHTITTIITKIQLKISLQEGCAYGVAGGVAEEVLSSIRTVVAFGGQRKEIKRYKTCLVSACQKGIKRSLFTSIGTASSRSIVFTAYALVLWYGFKLVLESSDKPEPEYTWKNFILISRIALHGIQHLCYIAPYFEAFTMARSAAAKVFNTIQRIPPIDSSSDVGLRPPSLKGRIQLTNVHFKYPARPTMPVLRGFNLDVSPGETVALVGTSGCGKSTIIKLLLRFYDVNGGSIQVDGIDIQNLHLGWLREHVGLVEQEPVLFSTTIEENIRMGRQDATREDIERASRIANAHYFIEKLPNKYETLVGHRGIQLSGGQKQRVAIARALVKNPRILLLDEPTSALDSESETVVQAALDQARRGRTTLLVAHRLCTVRTADKIIVLDEGIVKETGTHDELMKAKQLYYELVKTQINDPEVNGNEEMLSLQPDDPSAIGAGYEKMNEKPQHLHETNGHAIAQISTSKENLQDGKEHKSIKKLLKVYAKEWPYALVGFIASVLIGIHEPAFGIIIGEMFGGLSESMEVIKSKASFLCLIVLIIATTSFIFSFLQMFMFSIAGEKFLCRLRKMVFANIVIQDISFFDESRNSVGSLCSRLNSDASTLQGATGFQLSIPIQVISTLGAAIFLAFYYSWRLTLVIVAFVPFMLLSSALEGRITGRFVHREKESMENASKVASDAIENIRTVASLHQEVTLYKLYRSALSDANEKSLIKSHVRGAVYAFAMMLHYLAFITTMGYGCFLVSRKELLHSDLLKFLQGVLISIFMLADVVVFMPDFEKARAAALRLIGLIYTKPTIDAFSKKGLVKNSINGSVHFSNIHFAYPSRPKWEVLRGLEAVIQPGKTVALVGSSGCGKSTCAQLLMRFYDHNKGSLEVDGENVRNLNVASHRTHLSLVSQEPVLFGRSIAENIAYGDNTREKIDMSQIIEVARQANIHTFISSLPQGYDTPVGDRGTHLSGGQKQRISIARALIRNPRILLLDEATSALDTESEKVVQEALNLARFGRTCLVIAHRLATVQNADVILVLHNGEIAEKGTHQELIQKQGIYYRLLNMQS